MGLETQQISLPQISGGSNKSSKRECIKISPIASADDTGPHEHQMLTLGSGVVGGSGGADGPAEALSSKPRSRGRTGTGADSI